MNSGLNIMDSSALQAKKAVILARVSSKEQEEGYSIDAQKHRLETYCARRGLKIIETFSLVESSTSGDRNQFMAMIKFVKNQKQPIALVADKVDRVQRSFKEYPLLDALIQQGKIELHFNTENYVIHKDSVSQERLMWSMGVIMAQSYIDSMRDNVKRSMDQKIRLGEWIAKAPIGYVNVKDERGRGHVIRDETRAPLVIKIFETYATGAHTISEIVQKAKDWGLRSTVAEHPLTRSYIHALLQNPFYYGFMKVKGQIYEHRYERLISQDLFDQCQAVMKGWHKKPFKYGGKEYVLRGLLTCATTGRVVTADTKKRVYKNGNTAEWTYMRCWNPENPQKIAWVREEEVLGQIDDIFRRLAVPPDVMEDLRQYLRGTQKSERSFLRRQTAEWQREYNLCQTRLDKLMDLMLDASIERKDFEAQKARLRQRQQALEASLKGARDADDAFKDAFLAMLNLAAESHSLFKSSTTAQKRQLVNLVFANLRLKGATLCYELKKPFDRMLNLTNCMEWRARKDSNPQPSDP